MKNFMKDKESVPRRVSEFCGNGRAVCSCTVAKRQQLRVKHKTQFGWSIQCNPFCPYATQIHSSHLQLLHITMFCLVFSF